MEATSILDRDHLARYTLGDVALEQEVLGLFIGQIPETIARLRSCGEPDLWRRAAHTIKGSARVVGAWQLADVAARAEALADRPEEWDSLADVVEAAAQQVRSKISELCAA